MDPETAKKIVAAVNIAEVKKIAKDLDLKIVSVKFVRQTVAYAVVKPEIAVKLLAFLEAVLSWGTIEVNVVTVIGGQLEYMLQNQCEKDNVRKQNAIFNFMGLCYESDLVSHFHVLEAIVSLHKKKISKVVFLNFWLMVGEKMCGWLEMQHPRLLARVKLEMTLELLRESENGFGSEIFEEIDRKVEASKRATISDHKFIQTSQENLKVPKYDSPELTVIKEILNFPNYFSDQSSLDTVFLINLQKIHTSLPQSLRIPACKHLKDVSARHKISCNENLLDMRHVEKEKVEAVFKTIIERAFKEEDQHLKLDEITFLGCRDIPAKKIKTIHIKFFMSEVLDRGIHFHLFAKYLKKLTSDHPGLRSFPNSIIDFCVKFLSCSEELLFFQIASKKQVYLIAQFAAQLFNTQLLEVEKVTEIIEILEEKNLSDILKFFAYTIREEFFKVTKRKILEKVSTKEILSSFNRNDKGVLEKAIRYDFKELMMTKNKIRACTKDANEISIFLDQVIAGCADPLEFDPECDLSLKELITIVIEWSLENVDLMRSIELLRSLDDKYERFGENLYSSLITITRQLFCHPVGSDGFDWIKISNFADLLCTIYYEEVVENIKMMQAGVTFLNHLFEHLTTYEDFKIVKGDNIMNILIHFKDTFDDIFYNYLEFFFAIFVDSAETETRKKMAEEILRMMMFNLDAQINPRFQRLMIELYKQDDEEKDPQAFETITIHDATACARYFVDKGRLVNFTDTQFTDFVTVWRKKVHEGENAKFVPAIVDFLREEFKRQHMEQKGKLNMSETVRTAATVREFFIFGLITADEFTEFVMTMMHSVATDASLLNMKCFYVMVVMAECEGKIDQSVSFLVSVLLTLLQARNGSFSVHDLAFLRLRETTEADVTLLDKLVFESLLKTGRIENFSPALLEGKVDQNFCWDLVRTLKQMKKPFEDIVAFVNLCKKFCSSISLFIHLYMNEQIFFELYVKQRVNLDLHAVTNLAVAAAVMYDGGVFEFEDMLEVYLRYLFESCGGNKCALKDQKAIVGDRKEQKFDEKSEKFCEIITLVMRRVKTKEKIEKLKEFCEPFIRCLEMGEGNFQKIAKEIRNEL